MSDLVGNPEARFSHNEAQIGLSKQCRPREELSDQFVVLFIIQTVSFEGILATFRPVCSNLRVKCTAILMGIIRTLTVGSCNVYHMSVMKL